MSALANYQTLREWVEAGEGKPAFERYDQIIWFIRKHKDELVQRRVYLPGKGPRPSYVTRGFSRCVMSIIKREAIEALGRIEQAAS